MTTDAQMVKLCRDLAHNWAPILQALAHPERLLIALWLANTSSTVRELEAVTGLSQSLVSYHLKALREAGLVQVNPVGRANRYALANADLDKLTDLLGTLTIG